MKFCLIMNEHSYPGREYLAALRDKNIKIDVLCIGHFSEKNEFEEKRCGGYWSPAPQNELAKFFKLHFFENLKSQKLIDFLNQQKFDIGIQGGTGILPPSVLKKFKIGILNFHPGKLPEYQGCSAPEWQLLEEHPIVCTCHLVDKGIDTGPIYRFQHLDVNKQSYQKFRASIYPEIAKFLIEVLKDIKDDSSFIPQDKGLAQYRKKIDNNNLELVFDKFR